MRILNWIAYLSWALAAISLPLAFMDEYTFGFFIGLSVSIAISGVLFFAFSRIIVLLTDIRDALVPKSEVPKKVDEPIPLRPTSTHAELSAELARMKEKLA
ncbi:hypothetical protein [Paenirhodobacter sp. CAU 1674]|uniref:hypothetical protein n=1 Tax=Paenirhodobacter sp. CAU 1674 TaxID=3032596 RepID=UPI0023DC944C|nr:hypothetical protein [Paenirhodobacter sp. CAU 1674]MDF2141729.1 hypothetical protein [Paenirhodobacter sp. CAU 1674]